MNKRRWGWVCFGVLMVGLVLASYRLLNPPLQPGSVAYHVRELNRLESLKGHLFLGRPRDRSDWLHPRTWLWWVLGSHDREATCKEMDGHVTELIRMGHYQRREIVLSNNVMNEPWNQGILTNLFVGDGFHYFLLIPVQSNRFEVVAALEDAEGIERILRRWDAEKTKMFRPEPATVAE